MEENEKQVDEIETSEEELNEENAALEAGITASLENTEITTQVRQSFLDYAMSVIVSRAIPEVKDGLKPVHRRVIYGMYNGGYTYDKKYVKCAKVVGDVMGKFHPHGDAAIYDTLVRLAQDFSMRYPLVDGHGNFGNMDGDQAAASRYTECRMNKLSNEMVKDLDFDTVDYIPNYDGSEKEPVVLPTRFPNLLANGSDGIAVGMATKMPPHNFGELIDGIIAYSQNPDITTEDLMKYIKAPDFPTGGIIYGLGGIRDAYNTGRGSFKLRAKAEVKTEPNGKGKIIVTEIPYQVRKSDLVSKIGELAREKVIDGITSIKDFSKENVHIEIETRRDVEPSVILNKLYKMTQLEISYGVINLCIVDGVPKVLSLKEILRLYLEFQIELITRRTNYLKEKDERRCHIIDGLLLVVDNIDEVVEIAKTSQNQTIFAENLKKRFGLDDEQAKSVVQMTLGRLTGVETTKLIDERNILLKNIEGYNFILSSKENTLAVIIDELNVMKKQFNDPRRTEISTNITSLDDEDLIAEDDIVICLTKNGYIKRMSTSEFKVQNRGGVGVKGMSTYEDDSVVKVEFASTHADILFFSSKGRVYRKRGYEINESSRQSKGLPLVNLLNLDKDESIVSIICIRDYADEKEYENKFLFFATKQGIVKRTSLSEFERINVNGKIALSFKEDDNLLDVKVTDGTSKILIASRDGQLCMFDENEVRSMGRTAAGVRGINLKGSEVVGVATSLEGDKVLVISEKGYGKLSPIDTYRLTHRGSSGVITLKITEKTGELVCMKVVIGEEDYLAIKTNGVVIRSTLTQVREVNRNAVGVKMVNLQNDETVSSVAILPHEDEEIDEENAEQPAENAEPVKENQVNE